jgi:bifunctional pyridoxal-dependent enzyme with beta-cystathionase and maltose regulon repressor activities
MQWAQEEFTKQHTIIVIVEEIKYDITLFLRQAYPCSRVMKSWSPNQVQCISMKYIYKK